MTDPTSATLAAAICELTPLQLDRLRHDHPELLIPAMFGAARIEQVADGILQANSPGDALAIVQRYQD